MGGISPMPNSARAHAHTHTHTHKEIINKNVTTRVRHIRN